jgi:hypothetical protein
MMPALTIVGSIAPLSIGLATHAGASLQAMLATLVTAAYAVSGWLLWKGARCLRHSRSAL